MEIKQKLIDQFNKNSTEIVKVHLQEWKKRPYVDIRIWFIERPDKDDTAKPGHKGLTLSAEFLPQLIQALRKAQDILEKDEK